MHAYEIRHIVNYEETSAVGSVHYVHYVRWQGHCRERFLREHVPALVEALREDFALATVRCTCEYMAELIAFDEVLIRMRLRDLVQNRLVLSFEYWRVTGTREELVARGEQEIACMSRRAGRLVPVQTPTALIDAAQRFAMVEVRTR